MGNIQNWEEYIMIKLIVGSKGSGKTKTMIQMANGALKSSNGNVVCVEKGIGLTYDLSYEVRLVDVDQYGVDGYEAYCGFLCGLMAGNYDITHIFCDATFKICGKDPEKLLAMFKKLDKLSITAGVKMVFTISCDIEELPEELRAYII